MRGYGNFLCSFRSQIYIIFLFISQIIDGELEEDDDSDEETDSDDEENEEQQGGNHYNSCVTAVTHQKRAINNNIENSTNGSGSEGYAICPSASSSNLDPSLGAIAATEIFQHLQATSGSKNEVTTELAKILNVLQTTLKEDSSSSSSSSSSRLVIKIIV